MICLDKTWQQEHHDKYKRFLDNDKLCALIKHHDNRSIMTVTRDQVIPWQWQVLCLENTSCQQEHHDNYKRFLVNDKWYALIKHHDNRSIMIVTRDQVIPWQWQVLCLEKTSSQQEHHDNYKRFLVNDKWYVLINTMATGASWQIQGNPW